VGKAQACPPFRNAVEDRWWARRKSAFAHLTPLVLGRACPRSGLLSIQIIDALGLGDIGKCALQVAQAMEDNAAIDVGI
jgi:hypothetical protein